MQKVVLVTGASSGIGKEIAKLFLKKGYSLILSGRNQQGLEEFKNIPNVEIILGDITKDDTRKKIKEVIVAKYGRLDILVNNAV